MEQPIMPAPSRTLLAAIAVGVGSLAFAGGFAASSATAAPKAADPIVNVDAWSETAPTAVVRAQPVQLVSSEPAQPARQCSPWEVSDVAMEEVLREMQRRGWRPPNQGDAIASMVSLGVDGISVDQPNASMPTEGSSMITVLSDTESELLRTEQVTLEQLIVDETATEKPS